MADSSCTWTVTIVVIQDGVHTNVYDELEHAILHQALNGNLRYVIFYYNLHEGLVQIKELIIHKSVPTLKLVDSYPADIYNPETLRLFFIKHIKSELPSIPKRKHLLIINGHGAGPGFFAERTADKGIRMLTADRLADSIRNSIGKADMLVAISCYTQLLETGYCLKDAVEMFVAPQGGMTYYGIHYAKLFALLEQKPGSDFKCIAENITGNFLSKYTSSYFQGNGWEVYKDEQNPGIVSLSANYLCEYDAIIECVNELTAVLMRCFKNDGKDLLQAVIRARRSCTDLTPSRSFGFIDLCFFIDQLLKEAGPDQDLQQIHQRFGTIRQRCMAALHIPPGPPDLYKPTLRRGVRSTASPLFLSIFFPAFTSSTEQAAIREIYFSAEGPLQQFRKACNWYRFIRMFYNQT